ncbi:CDP-glucose 4,6-dehydratase [Azospirillum doebereinerae]|uniref:CDP-glucose 4,6-dehydratase n=1 Tax=Azospirillum doebereinerae TaxID=92933 RepID=A0A3S0V0H5_9PROT|nr:CDP-glucose 4,6-dehydratase [Azospirillum doebereinerae]RUQ68955.1 CDP-glucose 4,6-dehydratase [Azospirillum doebereinerae]
MVVTPAPDRGRETPVAAAPSGDVSPAFWRNRRVFVTGITGFKGSWLAEWLLRMGAVVRGFSLEPDRTGLPDGQPTHFDQLGLAGRLDHQVGDIRDRGRLAEAVADFKPHVVIHMAAQALVRASYADPVATYATNVMGTVHLLEACRHSPDLRSIVVVSSDKCYENREWIWGYRESDPMGGYDPYSNSKGCTELVAAAYRQSFFPLDRHAQHGIVLASARAGNVVGGGDWSPDRLIPDAMRALLDGTTLIVRSPKAVRPWQHVLEPLRGYLMLAEACIERGPEVGHGWNFGPADDLTLTVEDLMERLAAGLEGFRWDARPDPQSPHEATMLRLDCALARSKLGWRPRIGSRELIDMTMAWYRHSAAHAHDAQAAVTVEQIRRYGEGHGEH